MFTSLEISNQLGISVGNIRNTIFSNGIRGTYDVKANKMYYDEYQVDLIHYLCYFKYNAEYIIYESKINNQNL
ncbi:hypothetical protein [Flavobacterium phage FL-1]|nr:hypothetical protein [Flavobacterium phage FL-1]